MSNKNVIEWLKSTEIPMSKISESTGVSRKTLYNYMNGEATSESKLKLIETVYHNEINIKGEDVVLNSRYIIELQKDKIAYQQNEIDKLKTALINKKAESTHWDMLEFDYYVETKLHLKNMVFSRVINEVTNLELQSQKLGYTVDELKTFWDVGVKHKHNANMPIRKILDENTIKDINEKARTFPSIFSTLKSIVGHHYIPMPVIYVHKNGSKVPAISYNKISWKNMKVYSKVEFMS